MKISFVLSFAALICEVVCSRQPGLQWDPDTASDCVEWYDNGGDETCEYVRDYFTSASYPRTPYILAEY
jgi:hypothetical protein